jgi:hypothetical protein
MASVYGRSVQVTTFRPSIVIGPEIASLWDKLLDFIRSLVGAIIADGHNQMACVVIDEVARIIAIVASLEVSGWESL